MFTRSQQISSPLILPLLGSVIATAAVLSVFALPPLAQTLNLQQLLLRAAFDLTLSACIHVAAVTCIWRLIRDYIEPSASVLAIHLWAAVVWLPLIVTLSAERSLWISCTIPWCLANAISFLNLWTALPYEEYPAPIHVRVLFLPPSSPPLSRTLLPYCITIITLQAGLAALATGHRWVAAALVSAAIMLFFARHPFVRATAKSRRRFSNYSLLQTAAAFFLISTALTPYLQKAYGLSVLSSLLAIKPLARPAPRLELHLDYSGIILTLPAKPHPAPEPPKPSGKAALRTALAKPVVIPFDGAYWYFKPPDTRPRADAIVEQGDPIKANVRSTDRTALAMEAHQVLANAISGDCCHAIRVDLINGDNRIGSIQIELLLKDTSHPPAASLLLGTLPLASSQSRHISLNRPPVPESLSFRIPPAARGRRFDEIVIVVKPSSERALGGAKIAVQNFVLIP